MEGRYYSREYKISRAAYMAYCAFEYFVGILISGSFLAKLLEYIGLSDSEVGIVSSFISLAFLFQLISIMFVNKVKNIKIASLIFMMISQLLFMTLYLIPAFGLSGRVGSWCAKIFIILAYLAQYFISVFISKWANSYVHPENRGRFSALKELISLIAGMVFTLSVSFGFDYFEREKNIEYGFMLFAVVILVCSVLTFTSLLFIKSDKSERKKEETISFKETISHMFKNKKFLSVMLVITLFKCAHYMTAGFLGTYQIKELGFALGTISVITTVGTVARMVITIPFGKYSDKTSYASGMFLGYLIVAAAFLVMAFTSPAMRWFVVVYVILNSVSGAGTGQNAFNIMYKCVEQKYFIQANAITNVISGLLGFGSAFVGGYILDKIGTDGFVFFGITVYGQQVLSAVSFVIMAIVIVLSYFMILKPEGKSKLRISA